MGDSTLTRCIDCCAPVGDGLEVELEHVRAGLCPRCLEAWVEPHATMHVERWLRRTAEARKKEKRP